MDKRGGTKEVGQMWRLGDDEVDEYKYLGNGSIRSQEEEASSMHGLARKAKF